MQSPQKIRLHDAEIPDCRDRIHEQVTKLSRSAEWEWSRSYLFFSKDLDVDDAAFSRTSS